MKKPRLFDSIHIDLPTIIVGNAVIGVGFDYHFRYIVLVTSMLILHRHKYCLITRIVFAVQQY